MHCFFNATAVYETNAVNVIDALAEIDLWGRVETNNAPVNPLEAGQGRSAPLTFSAVKLSSSLQFNLTGFLKLSGIPKDVSGLEVNFNTTLTVTLNQQVQPSSVVSSGANTGLVTYKGVNYPCTIKLRDGRYIDITVDSSTVTRQIW